MAEPDVPEIELIIKASTIDGRRKGACIFCQVSFIVLLNNQNGTVIDKHFCAFTLVRQRIKDYINLAWRL